MNINDYTVKTEPITYRQVLSDLLNAGYPANAETKAEALATYRDFKRLHEIALDTAFLAMFADALKELNATSLPRSTITIIREIAIAAHDYYDMQTAYDKIVECIDILKKDGEL